MTTESAPPTRYPYPRARRFSLAARHLGMQPPFRRGDAKDATEGDRGRVRAWSLAHYQRTSTRARAIPSLVGGRTLEYFSVFKAGNNNIRFSLGVMSDVEVESLSGGVGVAEIGKSPSRSALPLPVPPADDDATDTEVAAVGENQNRNRELEVSQNRERELERELEEKEEREPPCTFTFLRDPLQRFVSGYAEFEYRQSMEFTSRDPGTCVTGDWATTVFQPDDPAAAEFVTAGVWPPKIGSKERAKLALKLIASLRWVNDTVGSGSEPPPAAARDPWPVRRDLNCYVAMHHLFPQASNFAHGLSAAQAQARASAAASTGASEAEEAPVEAPVKVHHGARGKTGGGDGGDGGAKGAKVEDDDGNHEPLKGGGVIEGLASSWRAPGGGLFVLLHTPFHRFLFTAPNLPIVHRITAHL